jgi:hypothetical protein
MHAYSLTRHETRYVVSRTFFTCFFNQSSPIKAHMSYPDFAKRFIRMSTGNRLGNLTQHDLGFAGCEALKRPTQISY